MKKILSLFSVLAVLSVFVACQKEPPIPVSDIELKEDSVRCYINDTLVSAIFSGTICYEGVIDSLTLRIGADSLVNSKTAKVYPINIKDEAFILTIDSLQASTIYYYRYCVDYGMKDAYETETRSFTTPAITVMNLPVVSTVVVDSLSITTNSAVVHSEVVDDGDYEVVECGFCYAEHPDPTIKDNLLICGEGTGAFSDTITGLTQHTVYYVRAYAIYSEGTIYSEVCSFLTLINSLPTVETLGVFNITATTATGKGQVTHEGAADVTDCGICWSENPKPTVDDNLASSGSGGLQTFSVFMTGLKEGVTYYVRAYALNANGVAYGEEVHFMATDGLPMVVTAEPDQITTTTADCGGEVTNDGSNEVTERGLYWGIQANLAQYDSIMCGMGIGSFTHTLTNLLPNTTYYFCAYAKNRKGTSRGEVKSFITNQEVTEPVVATLSVTQSSNVLKVKGIVKEDGGSEVIERGVCYSLDPSVDINHHSISHYTGGLGEFIVNVNITVGNTYYIRAYAKNTDEIGYGDVITVNTTIEVPVLTITGISNVTQNSAMVSGNVNDAGGGIISDRGVCWGKEHNPTISGPHQSVSGSTGSFTVTMWNLNPGTTYYVRAYAKNEGGTGYSEEHSFVTEAIPITVPTVKTYAVNPNNVTQTTARCSGRVRNNGGAVVSGEGFCYSAIHDMPEIGNDSVYLCEEINEGDFSGILQNLHPSVLYYVRAFAINEAGTGYGEVRTFTTKDIIVPVVSIDTIEDVTATTAHLFGVVQNDGGETVLERGFCYGTNDSPTILDNPQPCGEGIGIFDKEIMGLNPGTTYFVRAYARNNMAIGYSDTWEITTLPEVVVTLPEVTTDDATYITTHSAVCGGVVINDGGAEIVSRGVCYTTDPFLEPTIEDNHVEDISGSGEAHFTVLIDELSPFTTYYVRAYATNSLGTNYGEIKQFTTNFFKDSDIKH